MRLKYSSMAEKSQPYFSVFIVAVHVALVAFLFDKKHVILFSLLIPIFFWFASLTSLYTKSQYFNPRILDITSVVCVIGFGIYVYKLTDTMMKYWFLGWYTVFVLIFTNVIFKYRYGEHNKMFFLCSNFRYCSLQYIV